MGIFYKNNGAITVFLSLILVSMLILAGIAVDAVRIYGAKAIVADSAELALNTALASYDQVLKDAYGLLSISADENELSNNLIKYFDNTVNSMGLKFNEDDSYTKAIIEDIKNMISSPEKLDFNNLIDMETASFMAKGLDGTQLYHPETVKRQIVEYMKYRGVVSIADNFYDKLNVFKEVPKQQEVIESRVDYEIALSDIQKICKDIYIAVTVYSNLKNKLDNYSIENFYNDVGRGTDLYIGLEDINKLIFMAYKNDGLVKSVSQFRVDTKNISYLETYAYLSSQTIDNVVSIVGRLDEKKSADEIIKYYFNLSEKAQEIAKLIKYREVLEDKFNDYRNELIEKFEREEKVERAIAKKNKTPYIPDDNYALMQAEDEYYALIDALSEKMTYVGNYASDIKDRKIYFKRYIEKELDKLNLDLFSKYQIVSNLGKQASVACEKLETLINDLIPSVEEKNKAWKEKINSLSESDIKKSMKLQYDEVVKCLNKDEIKKLLDAMLLNKVYYQNYEICLKDVNYMSVSIISEKFKGAVEKISKDILFDSVDFDEAISKANGIYSSHFYTPDTKGLANRRTEEFIGLLFYDFLDKSFSRQISQEGVVKNYEKDAKKEKQNLFNTVNATIKNYEDNISANDKGVNNVPNEGVIYDDLATTLVKTSTYEASESIGKLQSSDDIEVGKKLVKSQTAGMKKSASIVEEIMNFTGKSTEGARDNLLVTEYMTEMFSCQTTGVNKNLEETLSGVELNKDNNFLYGSEMEYLLWGQNGDATSKNNLYTTSSLFGLRFILNTIYAYTDIEIRTYTLTTAVALAGITGFGVPIVQNILILALSMGESAIDISKLLEGEKVVIFKTYTTWILKPTGITKESVSFTMKTVAEESLDKISTQIVKLAEDFSDKNVNELEARFDEYAQYLADDLAMSISNLVLTPIQVELTIWIETGAMRKIDVLNTSLDTIYDNLRNEILSEEECFAKKIKLLVLDSFMKDKFEELKGEINNALVMVKDNIGAFRDKVETLIKSSVSGLTNEAKAIIYENGYDNLKNQAKQKLGSLTNDVKSNANKVIDDFLDKVTTGYSIPNSKNQLGNVKTSFGAGITMSYKEYIKVFIFLGMLAGNSNTYISRMCDLIKLNLVCSNSAPMPEFMLSNTYTMIKIDASVSVRTTFMRHKMFKNPWDENKCYVDYSCIYGY